MERLRRTINQLHASGEAIFALRGEMRQLIPAKEKVSEVELTPSRSLIWFSEYAKVAGNKIIALVGEHPFSLESHSIHEVLEEIREFVDISRAVFKYFSLSRKQQLTREEKHEVIILKKALLYLIAHSYKKHSKLSQNCPLSDIDVLPVDPDPEGQTFLECFEHEVKNFFQTQKLVFENLDRAIPPLTSKDVTNTEAVKAREEYLGLLKQKENNMLNLLFGTFQPIMKLLESFSLKEGKILATDENLHSAVSTLEAIFQKNSYLPKSPEYQGIMISYAEHSILSTEERKKYTTSLSIPAILRIAQNIISNAKKSYVYQKENPLLKGMVNCLYVWVQYDQDKITIAFHDYGNGFPVDPAEMPSVEEILQNIDPNEDNDPEFYGEGAQAVQEFIPKYKKPSWGTESEAESQKSSRGNGIGLVEMISLVRDVMKGEIELVNRLGVNDGKVATDGASIVITVPVWKSTESDR